MKTDDVRELSRLAAAIDTLQASGFESLGNWLFRKNGVIHDLSAADLTLIQQIEGFNLFVRGT